MGSPSRSVPPNAHERELLDTYAVRPEHRSFALAMLRNRGEAYFIKTVKEVNKQRAQREVEQRLRNDPSFKTWLKERFVGQMLPKAGAGFLDAFNYMTIDTVRGHLDPQAYRERKKREALLEARMFETEHGPGTFREVRGPAVHHMEGQEGALEHLLDVPIIVEDKGVETRSLAHLEGTVDGQTVRYVEVDSGAVVVAQYSKAKMQRWLEANRDLYVVTTRGSGMAESATDLHFDGASDPPPREGPFLVERIRIGMTVESRKVLVVDADRFKVHQPALDIVQNAAKHATDIADGLLGKFLPSPKKLAEAAKQLAENTKTTVDTLDDAAEINEGLEKAGAPSVTAAIEAIEDLVDGKAPDAVCTVRFAADGAHLVATTTSVLVGANKRGDGIRMGDLAAAILKEIPD